MPCLAGASSHRRAQEPVLIEMATGQERAAGGKVAIWGGWWDCSLGLNADGEEEDTGKARVGMKLNPTEVCSWESLCQGRSAERGWGQK